MQAWLSKGLPTRSFSRARLLSGLRARIYRAHLAKQSRDPTFGIDRSRIDATGSAQGSAPRKPCHEDAHHINAYRRLAVVFNVVANAARNAVLCVGPLARCALRPWLIAR